MIFKDIAAHLPDKGGHTDQPELRDNSVGEVSRMMGENALLLSMWTCLFSSLPEEASSAYGLPCLAKHVEVATDIRQKHDGVAPNLKTLCASF